jgi:hypothetical protein
MGRVVIVVLGAVKREVASNHQAACQDAKPLPESREQSFELHVASLSGHAL